MSFTPRSKCERTPQLETLIRKRSLHEPSAAGIRKEFISLVINNILARWTAEIFHLFEPASVADQEVSLGEAASMQEWKTVFSKKGFWHVIL